MHVNGISLDISKTHFLGVLNRMVALKQPIYGDIKHGISLTHMGYKQQ